MPLWLLEWLEFILKKANWEHFNVPSISRAELLLLAEKKVELKNEKWKLNPDLTETEEKENKILKNLQFQVCDILVQKQNLVMLPRLRYRKHGFLNNIYCKWKSNVSSCYESVKWE